MAEEGRVLVYSILGFFVGIGLFIKGFTWFRLKRMIENMPTSKIRSLAMGLAEIYGEVVPAEKNVLKSPLTGKDCVYYKYKIEERRSSGKNSYWATIKSGTDMVNFFLKDNTGAVLVDPKGAQVDIPEDYSYNTGIAGRTPPMVVSFLKNNDLSHTTLFGFNKQMRYTEYYIAPKDKLYILGTAGDNPFVEEATAQKNEEDIMIQKARGSIYYISDKPEKDILGTLRWKVIGGFFGGGALIVGCLTIILIYLGLF
ncbi:E3 ubiquitin ligase family protein [Candidatus Woesearchaeota archaeon]|nr:E3 ubiquitin ligase family protein [Candidatus Woesearchaeota archaeon]